MALFAQPKALNYLFSAVLSTLLLVGCQAKNTATDAAPAHAADTAPSNTPVAQSTTVALTKLSTEQQTQLSTILKKNMPQLPAIDEIRPAPMGLVEVRVGSEVFYAEPNGRFILQGEMIDLVEKTNLTKARLEDLARLPFEELPLQDAIVSVKGKGERKVAVFADPHCRYCKMLESNLKGVDNVTIYTFLIPILGPNSQTTAQALWCNKNRADAWDNWMLHEKAPATASCDTAALERNLAFAQKHKITGTPAIFFTSGRRVPGAIDQAEIEKNLNTAAAS